MNVCHLSRCGEITMAIKCGLSLEVENLFNNRNGMKATLKNPRRGLAFNPSKGVISIVDCGVLNRQIGIMLLPSERSSFNFVKKILKCILTTTKKKNLLECKQD